MSLNSSRDPTPEAIAVIVNAWNRIEVPSGDEFRRRVRALPMSQIAFADAIDRDYSTLRKWIEDKRPVPRYALIALEALEDAKRLDND